jgi:hypothetical protein
MDLRIVRFFAWQLGAVEDPPPCQLHDGRGSVGCWCFLPPIAKVGKGGGMISRPCPTKPPEPSNAPPAHVIVGWDE